MKPPSVLRVLSRPTALLKPHHSPKIAQLPALDARKFTVTTRRPFLPECLSQTHTLISGLHGMTGLPWVATIPLFAFLVRTVIHLPLGAYCYKLEVKRLKLYKESRIAVDSRTERRARRNVKGSRTKLSTSCGDEWSSRTKYNSGNPISFTSMCQHGLQSWRLSEG